MKLFKYILLLVVILLLTQCKSPKIITNTIVKDSIVYKEKITYRDTTVYVYIQGDTVTLVDTVYINKNGLVNSKKIYAFTSLAEASAWVNSSKLYLNLIQKDTTIERRLDSAIKESKFWMERYNKIYESKQEVITEYKTPGYMRFFAVVGICSIIFLGLFIWFKLK